jgi:hypothetical protein
MPAGGGETVRIVRAEVIWHARDPGTLRRILDVGKRWGSDDTLALLEILEPVSMLTFATWLSAEAAAGLINTEARVRPPAPRVFRGGTASGRR